MGALCFSGNDITITGANEIAGRTIVEYKGFLIADVTLGRHVGRDILSGIRDVFGGRSGSWEKSLIEGQQDALNELTEQAKQVGANAIVAAHMEDELVHKGGMINVKVVGTAVVVE